MTGDAIQLASSAILWPQVNPLPPPEEHQTYSNLQHVRVAYTSFHWMGEAEDPEEEGGDPEPDEPENRRERRMIQLGSGTLRDPQVRQRCVCPMTGCAYVVRAYTNILEPVREINR